MARRPRKLSPRDAALAIIERLAASGHTAYLAGGCVRDELLGLEPKDFDIATDAPPGRIEELFRRTASVGAAFGVMLVREFGPAIEVATFRADGVYSDNRRPDEIVFSDPIADANRRDFTINALFIDPLATDESGRIIDHVGGIYDLERRVLRAVGNPTDRLAEDHLRALRAVRFAARYELKIEAATADAIHANARELAGVSRERIGDEIRRMMGHPSRGRAATLLGELELDNAVLGTPAAERTQTLHLCALGEWAQETTALAAWAIDRGLDPLQDDVTALVLDWRRALMLSNDERDALDATLRGVRTILHEWADLGVAARKRAAASDWFAESLKLAAAMNAECEASVRASVATLSATPSGLAPTPLLSGDDLIEQGLEPGPEFKRILDAVYDAQLEDMIVDQSQARALAVELQKR